MKRKINLRDPEFEPTDEEIKELMHSAFAQVRAKREARILAVSIVRTRGSSPLHAKRLVP